MSKGAREKKKRKKNRVARRGDYCKRRMCSSCRKSSHSCSRESGSKSSWSSAGSKSYRNFNDSSSSSCSS